MKLRLNAVIAAISAATFSLVATATDIGTGAEFLDQIAAEPAGDYTLTADITFGGTQTTLATFSGTLDGAGHSISGLSQQLFGTLTGTVKNLTVKDWTAVAKNIFPNTANTYYGIIANEANDGAVIDNVTIKNCDFRSARTLDNQYVGGFIGRVTAATDAGVVIKNSTLDTCQVGSTGGAPNGGGFVGMTSYCLLTITNCEVVASSIVGGYAGGIVSRCDNTGSTNVIIVCSVGGTVTGNTAAGGICAGGRNTIDNSVQSVIEISRCRNNAAISAGNTANASAGGFYGMTYRNGFITITDSENRGVVSGSGRVTQDGFGVGGFIGVINSGTGASATKATIRRCVNYGTVTAKYTNAGGIVGNVITPNNPTTFEWVSNYGDVQAGEYAGGIGGFISPYYQSLTFNDVANYGSVVSTNSGSHAGGIIALQDQYSNFGTRSRVLSVGNVTADGFAGSIYGKMNSRNNNGGISLKNVWISNSVSAGQTGVLSAECISSTSYKCTVSFDAASRVSVSGAQHTYFDVDGSGKDLDLTAVPAGALTDGAAVAALGSDWEQGTDYPHLVFENDCGPAAVKYNVTFLDWDGTQIGAVQSVIRGGSAAAPADPVRTGYTFGGWDVDFSSVMADTTVTATYAINHYTVDFEDYDGTALSQQQIIEYGADATAPVDPSRTGYTFTGWNPAPTAIESNTVCIAQYSINRFQVRFLDWDDSVLQDSLVDWGTAATAPADPSRAGYTFTGWDKTFGCITEAVDVKATYTQGVVTTYNVTFKDWDGAVISEQIVPEGERAIAPVHPEREGYDPAGWDKSFDNIIEDTEVTAAYTIKYFDVTYLDWDDSVYAVVPTAWHASAVPPAVPPTREWYTFKNWDGDASCVTVACSVKAVYDPVLERTAANAEELAFHMTCDDPRLVITLTTNIVVTDWEMRDFGATIKGEGYSIEGLTDSFLGMFSGTLENIVFDGDPQGTGVRTTLNSATKHYGLVCVTNLGGRVSNVTVRNYGMKNGYSSYMCNGFFAAVLADGAVLDGCTIEDSCLLEQRNNYVGSFAGATAWTSEYKETAEVGAPVASILSCTNCADISTWYSGTCVIGGILGLSNTYDGTLRPEVVISNCVNYGDITSEIDSPTGYAGGIVGERGAYAAGQSQGCLTIVDCANYGNVGPVAASMTYGGCIGHVFRLANVNVTRFVNRGRVGGPLSPKGNAITGGSSGGFIGYLQDGYNVNPIIFTDSANYGDVYGFSRAGGFFDQFTPNEGHNYTMGYAVNCANYGSLTALSGTGLTGEIYALFGSNPAVSDSRIYGAFNSFFPTDNLIQSNNCSFVHTDTCVTAMDEGYVPKRAMKQLRAYAAANDYGEWCLGKVNGRVVPELKAFCLNPAPPEMFVILVK